MFWFQKLRVNCSFWKRIWRNDKSAKNNFDLWVFFLQNYSNGSYQAEHRNNQVRCFPLSNVQQFSPFPPKQNRHRTYRFLSLFFVCNFLQLCRKRRSFVTMYNKSWQQKNAVSHSLQQMCVVKIAYPSGKS